VSVIRGEGFRLRRATPDDVALLVGLAQRPEVADSLAAVSPWAEDDTLAALAAEPADEGRLVLEVEETGGWAPAGALAFRVANRRSRIAYLFGLMVDPAYAGRGLGSGATRLLGLHLIRDLGYHRVQLEVYGFNERAARVVERAGFVAEGRRRKAYLRHGDWVDGLLYALVEEDLADGVDS
jgi:RimJ/RimL family protein N-acetyltransferase